MHNVLLILLHRPFVSDGDLHSSPSNAINSFLVCATAAKMIVHIVSAYDAAYSIQRAPYLISYATYVSATIHVRIAAQRESGSEAHLCLGKCLDVFNKNQETNWAVKRANLIIQNLMKRMSVSITESDITGDLQAIVRNDDNHNNNNMDKSDNNNSSNNSLRRSERMAGNGKRPNQSSNMTSGSGENTDSVLTPYDAGATEHVASDLDIDAIIQSFIREQQRKPQAYINRSDQQQETSSSSVIYPSSSQMAPPDAANQHQWYPSTTSFVHDDMVVQNMQNLAPPPGGPGGYGGVSYDQQQQPFSWNLSVDDMLFGFNSSEIEGIGWEFDGRVG